MDTIDVFLLYDFRPEVHTPARLAGARMALDEARAAGQIRAVGATCYAAYDALAEAIEADALPLDIVMARFNYFDQAAGMRLSSPSAKPERSPHWPHSRSPGSAASRSSAFPTPGVSAT